VPGGTADPKAKGRTPWKVASAKLVDAKTVLIEIPEIKPVMQVMLDLKLKSKDGADLAHTVYHTIHVLPEK
jgi:hypothetical protein